VVSDDLENRWGAHAHELSNKLTKAKMVAVKRIIFTFFNEMGDDALLERFMRMDTVLKKVVDRTFVFCDDDGVFCFLLMVRASSFHVSRAKYVRSVDKGQTRLAFLLHSMLVGGD
jgi:hypothetical protein